MKRRNIIDRHEEVYAHLKVMKSHMDMAMQTFEVATSNEIEDVRRRVMNRARNLVNLLEEL